MAVHDRLKPPSLETTPTRPSSALPLALLLTVLAAGFAFAMPRLQTVSAEAGEPESIVEVTPISDGSEVTPVIGSSEAPEEDAEEPEGAEDAEGDKDNHGSAVSTAAHCDVKGKAHGELVRSIAHNKVATVADAESACTAALAAEASASAAPDAKGSSHGGGHSNGSAKSAKPTKVPPAAKPVSAPKAPKPDKPAKP